MRRFLLPLLLLGVLSLHAQSFIDNAQINGSFQTDAQYYRLDQGIDITDLSVYDLVVDTDHLDPDQVIETIMKGIEGYKCS